MTTEGPMFDREDTRAQEDATRAPIRPAAEKRIGRVVSVSGSHVIVIVEAQDSADHRASRQIGALVKMHSFNAVVYGLVSGLSAPMPAKGDEEEIRIVEIDLLGETRRDADGQADLFARGVSSFPARGAGVFAATQLDLMQVYAPAAASPVRVGTLHQDRTIPAYVLTDDLLGKHFAILGSTGCGKSCAVAILLKR